MASLKTYITITTLKRIPEPFLRRHIGGIKGDLEESKIMLPNGKIKYLNLTHYLQEHCPQDLENFICSFALVAKPEFYDRISAKLQSYGVDVSPTDDLEKIAAELAERDMYACNAIAARQMADESHTYSHYITTIPHTATPLTDAQIAELKENILAPYFEKIGRAKYADIYPHITRKFAFYCISHGSPKTREHSVGEPEEMAYHTFRPELVDIVRINLANAEISVFTKKTSSRELKEFYVKVIGRMVAPTGDYVPHLKFNLSAFMNPKIFTIGDFNDKIWSIFPSRFTFVKSNGEELEAKKNVGATYMDCIENRHRIKSMVFDVCFVSNPKKKHKVTIHSESRSEFPIGANEEIIEEYFTAKGIIRNFYREPSFKLETQSLALSN